MPKHETILNLDLIHQRIVKRPMDDKERCVAAYYFAANHELELPGRVAATISKVTHMDLRTIHRAIGNVENIDELINEIASLEQVDEGADGNSEQRE